MCYFVHEVRDLLTEAEANAEPPGPHLLTVQPSTLADVMAANEIDVCSHLYTFGNPEARLPGRVREG